MKDLGEIIRVGLPNARTRHDVIELCKRTLIDLEAASFGHKLFIRYVQPIHTEPKIAVGVAFIDPADVHLTEGLRGIRAGGAVCHPADNWSKDLGKTIAVLRAQFIPGDVAASMTLRMSPWDRLVPMPEKALRILQLKYPWSAMGESDEAFPALARPAVIDAIRWAFRWNTPHILHRTLINKLVDAACTLPSRMALTLDERAARARAGRQAAIERPMTIANAPKPPLRVQAPAVVAATAGR